MHPGAKIEPAEAGSPDVLKKSPEGLSPGKLRQEKANTEEDTGLLDSSRAIPEAEGNMVFIGLSDKLVFIPEGKTHRSE